MATTDLEKLVVQMSADFRQYERQMAKMSNVTARELRKIEKRAAEMDKRLSGFGSTAFNGLLMASTALGSALSVREVARYADAWTGAKNALAVAGVVGENQIRTLDALYVSAQKNAAPITALADLYGKASQANDNLQQSQARLLKFTDGIAVALKVEGKSAQEASGALTQLGQLLGSARVQAEEFNSINEGARPILIAVANGLDEAGGSVSRLKQLVNDGKVSGRQFFNAFLDGFPAIEKMAANSTQTIEQGLTKVNNALTKYIGETDSSLGASQRLVQGLNALADNFDQTADTVLALAGVIAGALVGRSIAGMIVKLGLAGTALTRFAAAIRTAMAAGSLTTALGGVSAAAGPLGFIIGGTVVGALALYSKHASEAQARSDAVTAELKRLDLGAEEAAEKIGDVAEASEELTDGEIYRKVKMLADEYDRLSNMGEGFFGWLRDDDALGGLVDKAKELTHQFEGDSVDLNATFGIHDMLRDLERGRVGFQDVINKMREIRATEVSQPVADLAYAAEKTAQKLQQLDGAKASNQVNELKQELEAAKDELLDFSETLPVSLDQRKAIVDIIKDFDGTKEGAAEARRALEVMADADPDTAGYVAKLTPIFSMLQKLVDKSREFMTLLNAADVSGSGGLNDNQKAAYQQYSQSRAEGEKMVKVGNEIIANMQAENALSKDRLALKKEEAALADKIQKAGGFATAEQITAQAKANLAATDRRSKSGGGGGSGKSSKDDFTRTSEQITRQTDALLAQAEAQKGLNPVIEDYGYALEKAGAAQDLLTAAGAAGLTVDDALKSTINQLAEGYAVAAVEANRAADANYRLRAAADDVKSTGKDVMGGFISDMVAGTSAADALGNALGRIGDKLLDLALNSLFNTGPGLGGFFSALGGLGKKDGGAVRAATGGRIDATGGGRLSGPGGPRGDKIPAWLSDGEHVINARAARANRPLLDAINSGKMLKLADGGAVGRYSLPSIRSLQSGGRGGDTHVSLGGISIAVPEGTSPTDAAEIARLVAQKLDHFSRFVLPQRVQDIQRNPNRIG